VLNQQIISTVLAANNAMTPVKIGAAQSSIDESYNRIVHKSDGVEMLLTNPQRINNRPVDKTLSVIHFKTLDDQPFLTWVFYNAHPVITMALNDVVICADYPGHMAKSMQQKLHSQVLFSLGAAGDVNPYDANSRPEVSMQKSAAMGANLADVAIRAVDSIENYQSQGQFLLLSQHFSKPDASVGSIMLTSSIALAHFPGEYFNDFGLQLRQKSPVKHTFFYEHGEWQFGLCTNGRGNNKRRLWR
jgi:hypothetical protein